MNIASVQRILLVAAYLLCRAPALSDVTIEPAKIEDKVSITLGQKATIQFQALGDALKRPLLVNQPDEKRPSLDLEFRKADEAPIVILSMKHSFPRALRCRCLMRLKGQKGYVETSMLPSLAGLAHFESWTDPIEDIILFDFKLTDDK